MKVYVAGRIQRGENEPPKDPLRPWEDTSLTYSSERGDWLMYYKESAELELDILTKGRFHVNEHYCQFELEEEGGTYAIVCRNHPPMAEEVRS